jgi:hypothetical protein
MGILADFYVADESAAVRYDGIDKPERSAFDRAEYKNVTPLELSTLCAILKETEWTVELLDQFPCLLVSDGSERLIHKLPSSMLAHLTRLAPEALDDVSGRWAATQELRWPQAAARQVICDLIRLARIAIETDRDVYLWNCV